LLVEAADENEEGTEVDRFINRRIKEVESKLE